MGFSTHIANEDRREPRHRVRRAIAFAAAITVAAVPGVALVDTTAAHGVAAAAGSDVFPPTSEPYGVDYETWAVRWSKWAFGTTTPQNPLVNPDNCGIGQRGQVRFLPAASDVSQRANCTVPAGHALLATAGGSLGTTATGDGNTPAQLKADVGADVAEITAVKATVDGRPVADMGRFLVSPQVFTLDIPADNIFGLPGPISTRAAFAGYFIVLRPLDVGHHTVTLSNTFSDGETFKITFHVTVVR